jgi:CheY-like chemotaxis protein
MVWRMKLNTPLASIFDSQSARLPAARWMVVDDNRDVLDSTTMLLEALGRAEIYKFHSAEEALNCFALYPDKFALVITDFGLPGLNGLELCQRIREISASAKVILSTGSTITPEQFARNAGFDTVLQKPYTAAELWRVVNSVLPEQMG